MKFPVSFQRWLKLTEEPVKTRQVITHLTHLEDLILTKQAEGAKEAYQTLTSLSDLFEGHADVPLNLSIKIDGAPSIMVGNDPEDGKFFVSTKGAFKVAKSQDEINKLYGDKPGLYEIMSLAFKLLKPMSWPFIFQGDVLFTPKLKQPKVIDGVAYVTFKPNTITYAVPTQTDLGQRVIAASLGISFHTRYTGTSLRTLTPNSDANVDVLKPTPNVVFISNQYRDLSGTISFTADETQEMQNLLGTIRQLTETLMSQPVLNLFQDAPGLRDLFMQFQNQLVREGKPITATPKVFVNTFVSFLTAKQEAEQQKRFTDAGKTAVADKFANLIALVQNNSQKLSQVLAWQQAVTDAKLLILSKLNTAETLATFYSSDEGLVAGPHEGFVASDSKGNFVKLVDRGMFSRLNFAQGRFTSIPIA